GRPANERRGIRAAGQRPRLGIGDRHQAPGRRRVGALSTASSDGPAEATLRWRPADSSGPAPKKLPARDIPDLGLNVVAMAARGPVSVMGFVSTYAFEDSPAR